MADPRKKLLDEVHRHVVNAIRWTIVLVLGVAVLVAYMLDPWTIELGKERASSGQPVSTDRAPAPEFQNGIHLSTGFKEGEHVQLVINSCTGCHSAKMVTQNRATREGWKTMIRWMQETQNLWDLGDNEPLILDYLAKYYGPEQTGVRRKPLTDIQWYELDQ